MEVYYRIESRKYHREEMMRRNGKKREKFRCEVLADIKVDTFEEAVPVLREQCANPEADSVSIWYEEGSFGECCTFERDETWKPSYALECYCYSKSQVDQYVEDRKQQLKERMEHTMRMCELSKQIEDSYPIKAEESRFEIKKVSSFDENNVENHPLYNIYNCQIIASHDEWDEDFETEDDWDMNEVTDSHEIACDCFEHYEEAMEYLKKQIENEDVNSIEIIALHGRTKKHISFFRDGHPYAELDYSFNVIDDFIAAEKVAHVKRVVDPDPFIMEMQFMDLFAGITPELFMSGKTVEQVKTDIPDCDEQVHDLLYLLSHCMMEKDLADEFDDSFEAGLKFFWDGIVDGSTHAEYWIKAWQEGSLEALADIFEKKYLENMALSVDDIDFLANHTRIAYLYYFYGVYFHGLKFYVA